MECELIRIIAHAHRPPIPVGSPYTFQVMGPNTFYLSLSFPHIALSKPYIPAMCADTDAMEYRVDLLSDRNSRRNVLHQLQLVRRYCRPNAVRAPVIPFGNGVLTNELPVVYTVRTADQAGTFPNDERGIRQMLDLLGLGSRAGVEVLDVESAWDPNLVDPFLHGAVTKHPQTMILGSHHVVGEEVSTEEAIELFQKCALDGRAHGAKVVLSIADSERDTMARDAALIASGVAENDPTKVAIPSISLVLGEVGLHSRTINLPFTPVTHESLPFVAAPGQLSAKEIMKRRVERNIVKPKQYVILGHNIDYSVSPQMHNAAFKATGLPHNYGRADVEHVQEFVDSELFQSQSFGGCSITIPHKQAFMKHVDVLSDAAREIGSINTVTAVYDDMNDNGKRTLYGDNTDWIGIYSALHRKLGAAGDTADDTEGGYALILGGGGTARAAAYAAKQLGLNRLFYNRTPSKARDLADQFGGDVLQNLSQSEEGGLGRVLKTASSSSSLKVVISTLPAAANFELPEFVFPQKPIVFDVNYKPYNTLLLLQGESFGCDTVRGSEMLWGQGVEQFQIWTGRLAPYGVMKDVVLKNCLPTKEQE